LRENQQYIRSQIEEKQSSPNYGQAGSIKAIMNEDEMRYNKEILEQAKIIKARQEKLQKDMLNSQ
jgi:hypothetical protein